MDANAFAVGQKVPHSIVVKALEAAVYAPNHKRTEPWRFAVLGTHTAAELCRLIEEHIGGQKGEAKRKSWESVPTWIVAFVRGQSVTEVHTQNREGATVMSYTQLEDYAATACAIQNAMLSMHAAGVGTKWSTGGITRKSEFRELVQAESHELVVGLLMCGILKDNTKVKMPRKRRPVLTSSAEDDEGKERQLIGKGAAATRNVLPVLTYLD